MPSLTSDQRVSYVQAIWETFCQHHHVRGFGMSPAEFHIASKWANRGIPLAVVLQGIVETKPGTAKTLAYCEASVEDNISRWHSAVGGLTTLPEAGPLEEPQ